MTSSPPRRVRVAFWVGLTGLVLAVLAAATAPSRFDAMVWVELPTTPLPTTPGRYADYLPATASTSVVGLLIEILVGSAAGAAVLVALAGLREGRRRGRVGVGVAVVLGVVAVGAQLQLRGMAASTLVGEVVALGLGAAALVLTALPSTRTSKPDRRGECGD